MPTKHWKYCLADLEISTKAKTYVNQVLNSNRLSYGPFAKRFEKMFARLHERKYAIVSNSGTSGLQVAIHAAKELFRWNDNDEILVPAVTFIATSNVVLQNRLKPVFVDVEPNYYCIDPNEIEKHITPKTRAILPVHLFGQSADMDQICSIAKKYNLKVIEDACEIMFVNYNQHPVGSRGDIAVFSSYVAHIIVTGVGGIVVCNDIELARMCKSLMFHGRDHIYLSIDDDDNIKNRLRLNSLIERRFQFDYVGYSYRITEMECALGLAQLEKYKTIMKNRQKVGKLITQELQQFSKHFQLPEVRQGAEHIYMLYPIVITNPSIDRDDLLLHLEKNGVETRLFMPLLTQPIYKKLFGDIELRFPVARNLVKRGFIIGSHPLITKKDIYILSRLIQKYLKQKGYE